MSKTTETPIKRKRFFQESLNKINKKASISDIRTPLDGMKGIIKTNEMSKIKFNIFESDSLTNPIKYKRMLCCK